MEKRSRSQSPGPESKRHRSDPDANSAEDAKKAKKAAYRLRRSKIVPEGMDYSKFFTELKQQPSRSIASEISDHIMDTFRDAADEQGALDEVNDEMRKMMTLGRRIGIFDDYVVSDLIKSLSSFEEDEEWELDMFYAFLNSEAFRAS